MHLKSRDGALGSGSTPRTVTPRHNKRRREDVLPLRSDTVLLLKEILRGKMPHLQAFALPPKAADMLKADLADAGIAYVDASGRVADFHSLRHSTGSLLATAGTNPKVAQSIMRHSDINLTMGHYTHVYTGQESLAVENLPDLTPTGKGSQRKTGTDDAGALASCLAISGEQQRSDTKSNDDSNPSQASKNTILTTPPGTRTPNPLIKSQLLCQLS